MKSTEFDFRVDAQHVGFFETPVAYTKLKGGETLMASLKASIRSKRLVDPGLVRSNIGGWHSDTDMLFWGGPAATKLAETAINIAKRMTHFQDSDVENYNWVARMWANVTSKGGLNHMHAHPGNLWAAVLYIDMGDEGSSPNSSGGEFYIEDPRFPMSAMHNTAVRLIGSDGKPQQYQLELKVEKGNLILFPAWLRHGVRTYTGESERISIAINIDAQRK
ncbi:MAG: hypothetical protein COA96_04420 [SAR86 cluster bacterium]|uniref:Fe2OG dioxygenase domain-containing protein n=1 Tax=SAR86 cluster bacterium TaxID=2030880 RepID=A0A2A5B6Y2_9GAMM|nr:MAG: hypothetical protein COA96_04420 [SAR86 cluster bacterium]